jgi:hypothetical protein
MKGSSEVEIGERSGETRMDLAGKIPKMPASNAAPNSRILGTFFKKSGNFSMIIPIFERFSHFRHESKVCRPMPQKSVSLFIFSKF